MLLTAAISNAFYDSSAFIAITGQVATSQYDSGALQEEYRHFQADFPSIAKVITKRSFQAHSVADLGKFLPKAFKLAKSGRPGPVHIDVPYDLWVTKADVEVPEPEERSSMLNWRTPGSPEAVARALELLLEGAPAADPRRRRRRSCPRPARELAAFAEHVNVPVYTSFMGKGALSAEHPLHLGIAGCWGEYPAQEAARNADVILAFGCRFSDIHSLVVGARLHVQHPADEADPRRHRPAGDRPQLPDRDRHRRRRARGAPPALELAEKQGPKRERSPWNDQVEAYKAEWSNFIEQEKASDAVPIDPRRVIKELRAAAPDDTLMITDTGNHQTWVEQYWDVARPADRSSRPAASPAWASAPTACSASSSRGPSSRRSASRATAAS